MTQQHPPPVPPWGQPDPQQWRTYGEQPYPGPPSVQPPASKEPGFWRGKGGALVLLVGALAVACNLSSNQADSTSKTAAPPTRSSAVPVAPAVAAPATSARLEEETPAAAPAVESHPTGPLTTFSDGTYEVGTGDGEVAPGKYKAPGGNGMCYWARLKHNDGELGDIIGNNVSEGQSILNVKASDGYVEVRGCEFTKAA